MSTAAIQTRMVSGVAGTPIAVHETGEGRPLLLLHGLMSNAHVNWIKYGHAARLAEAGYRVVMPDFPAHGQSGAPHDPAAYPADLLAKTAEAVIAELGLEELDLAGFSLGSRTSVRLIERGLTPRRVILAGMGIDALFNWDKRHDFFLNAIDRYDVAKRGDPDYFSIQFMKTTNVDVVAIRLLLESGSPLDPSALNTLVMPTLVLCGTEDRDNGDPDELAAALPNATRADVPGGHMSCITKAELSQEMVRFLTA